jgi:hypothetical protein
MLAWTDGKVGKAAAEIEPLVRIAGGRLKGFTVTRWSDFPEADFWPRITSRLFNIQRSELIPHLT